jgi:hypothetical protein
MLICAIGVLRIPGSLNAEVRIPEIFPEAYMHGKEQQGITPSLVCCSVAADSTLSSRMLLDLERRCGERKEG